MKAILFAAILSLAIMVVALGVAAKHSQFEQHANHSFYLAKAVKMVSDDGATHTCPAGAPALVHPQAIAVENAPAVPLPFIPVSPGAFRNIPLLV